MADVEDTPIGFGNNWNFGFDYRRLHNSNLECPSDDAKCITKMARYEFADDDDDIGTYRYCTVYWSGTIVVEDL